MSTPAIAAIRRRFPDARIDALVAPWGRAALEGNPDVDRLLLGPAPWYDPRLSALPPPSDLLRAACSLRREPHDWGFDFRGDPRVVLFYLLPAARRRFGFSGLGLEGLLTDSLPYDRERSMLDSCLDLARAAGASPVTRRPVFCVDEVARERARAVLSEAGVAPGRSFAVIAPAANRTPAQWDAKRFAQVATGFLEDGLVPVLVGRDGDRAVTSSVAERIGPGAADLTGRTSLRDLAAVLERAEVLVCNDSGPAHLAAAVACPTVAVFGPTDPTLTFPYEDGRTFASVHAPIDHPRPCFRSGCDSDHGFSRIESGHVLAVARRVVGSSGRARGSGA